MGKFKTKKTLLKRVRLTKNGKIIKGQIGTGHLKVKWSTNKRFRKKMSLSQPNKGHIKKFKRMLGKNA